MQYRVHSRQLECPWVIELPQNLQVFVGILDFITILHRPTERTLFRFPVVRSETDNLIIYDRLEAEILSGLTFVDTVGGNFHFHFLHFRVVCFS